MDFANQNAKRALKGHSRNAAVAAAVAFGRATRRARASRRAPAAATAAVG